MNGFNVDWTPRGILKSFFYLNAQLKQTSSSWATFGPADLYSHRLQPWICGAWAEKCGSLFSFTEVTLCPFFCPGLLNANTKTAIKAEWFAQERDLPICSPWKGFELGRRNGEDPTRSLDKIALLPMWLLGIKKVDWPFPGRTFYRANWSQMRNFSCFCEIKISWNLLALNQMQVGGKFKLINDE